MQRKSQILLGVGGVAALSLAAAAFAVGAEGHDPMRMFDKDGNGALSQAEVAAGAEAMFAKVDSNKDGRLTQDEMRAHHRAMEGHHKGGPGGHGGPRGEGGPPGRMHMDSNGDGAVTLDEVRSTLAEHFAQADSNKDGSISREEMDAMHRSMHGRP